MSTSSGKSTKTTKQSWSADKREGDAEWKSEQKQESKREYKSRIMPFLMTVVVTFLAIAFIFWVVKPVYAIDKHTEKPHFWSLLGLSAIVTLLLIFILWVVGKIFDPRA